MSRQALSRARWRAQSGARSAHTARGAPPAGVHRNRSRLTPDPQARTPSLPEAGKPAAAVAVKAGTGSSPRSTVMRPPSRRTRTFNGSPVKATPSREASTTAPAPVSRRSIRRPSRGSKTNSCPVSPAPPDPAEACQRSPTCEQPTWGAISTASSPSLTRAPRQRANGPRPGSKARLPSYSRGQSPLWHSQSFSGGTRNRSAGRALK